MPDMSTKAPPRAKEASAPKEGRAGGLVLCEGRSTTTGKACARRVKPETRWCNQHTPTTLEEGPPHRCTAWSRTANAQCRQPAIPGGTVCRFHGGGNPDVKRKAALRLASLVDPAIGTLAREMVKAPRSSDRQRAANSILDRAGISRASSAEAEVARSLLLERLISLKLERSGGAPELPVIEGEVVVDGIEPGRLDE